MVKHNSTNVESVKVNARPGSSKKKVGFNSKLDSPVSSKASSTHSELTAMVPKGNLAEGVVEPSEQITETKKS